MYCTNCGASIAENALFCPVCGAKQEIESVPAPAEKRCPVCGAVLEPDSVFCESCGARLTPDEPADEWKVSVPEEPVSPPPPPVTVSAPILQEPVFAPAPAVQQSAGGFTRTGSLTESANLAVSRNPSGEWSSWDNLKRMDMNVKKLLRHCEREDKIISSYEDHEGVICYVVSPGGSIGHIYEDDTEEGNNPMILEWLFFAPGESGNMLPTDPGQV